MIKRKDPLLILEDNVAYRDLLVAVLRNDYEPLAAGDLRRARQRIEQGVTAVICDIHLANDNPGNRDGLKIVEEASQAHPMVPFIVLTSFGSIDQAVSAMKFGASDFIQKESLDLRDLPSIVAKAIERCRLKQQVDTLKQDLRQLLPQEFVGTDPAMVEIQEVIDQVAMDGTINVLITGESGTGKELVARAIHSRGVRRERPFVAIAVSGLARSTVESELFGHVKGAFTGADAPRQGFFERAKGGVLFLDEIGEMDGELQVKLLRALETRTFMRVGSTEPIDMDVQLVTATNRDLEAGVRNGHIRQDFYFRVKTVEICLPPLRERACDITPLAEHFLSMFRNQGRTRVAGFSDQALSQLRSYRFPGNIRELRSIVERAMILTASKGRNLIEPADLLLDVAPALEEMPHAPVFDVHFDLDRELARVELLFAQAAIKAAEGKKDNAWRLLKLNDRFALRRRIMSIAGKYPEMLSQFPLLADHYK